MGGGPRAKPFSASRSDGNVAIRPTPIYYMILAPWLLLFCRGHGGDFDFVSLQRARNCNTFPGLLVERGQHGLVRGIESVNLVVNDQGIFRSLLYAGAGAFGGRTFHVFSAAHGVADFAGEGLFAGSQG